MTESQSIGADSFAIHNQAMRDGRRIAFVREGSNLAGPLMARGAGHFLSRKQPEIIDRGPVPFGRDLLPQ